MTFFGAFRFWLRNYIYSGRDQKGTILTLAAYRKSLESPIDMGFVP